MVKRVMVAIVGAGMGALVGLLVDFMGAGNIGLIACAVVGAIIPLAFLGQPGH